MKIDLHVHSKFSTRPSQWVLQKLNCPESFTEPQRIYEEARRKGMGLVTISDHNRIEGALSIAHLPGTFVSEEITSYFPEDRCKVHVLVYDIDEGGAATGPGRYLDPEAAAAGAAAVAAQGKH